MSATSDAPLLQGLLAAEHAAIYAYGVLGARLDRVTRDIALRAYDAHRARRSALITRLQALGADVPAPAAAYDVVVTTRGAALLLAIRIEVDDGVRWHDLIAATQDPSLRALAVTSLTDTARRAALFRQAAGIKPLTEPFPGRP